MNRAVVIGGASGIGLATVDAFVGEGMQVVVADRDVERAEQVAATRDGCSETVGTSQGAGSAGGQG